uniref:DDE Tnp4 domain-containing protein n=1 Tax=Oncorhynchus kisutch TaxID=8019 RepID=A0A8C7DRS1_ONCKI
LAQTYLKIVVDLACSGLNKRPARPVLVDTSNPLNYFDEIAFQDQFHMYKENALEIISLLQPRLSSLSQRGRPLPNSLQVLITLRFLASGIFHCETVDLCGASEATVCLIVHKVCRAICELRSLYIKFLGAAGCHVPIKCPTTPDAEEYKNCKNWFSINVQGVCTSSLEFSNIFQRGQHSGLLFGDSGYDQSNFVFTPYINPTTAEQQRYNQAHIYTGEMAEHMLGVWKNRFHCLSNTLNFKPRRCCKVIIFVVIKIVSLMNIQMTKHVFFIYHIVHQGW